MHAHDTSWRAWGRVMAVTALLVAVAWGTNTRAGDRRSDRSGNYLVIAAENYFDSAPLNQFVAAKQAMGFDVTTYSVTPGTSNATIKGWIQDLWNTSDAPDYILLVGDTNGSTSTATTIPHFTGGGSKNAPTDLPYACMDLGDDWYPDIAIGRFSVTSVSMLQTVVDKSLFVEAGNFSDPEYVKRGAFLANPSTYGMAEPTHDYVIERILEPHGYVGVKLYSSEGAGTQDVTDAVNNGCLWVGYYGHSGSTGWWDPSFNQGNVQALTNEGLYGVAWSFSCNVGNFTIGECFGETWLREANKGAAAVIFPSGYIYWGSIEAWEPSTVLEQSFFKSFFKDEIWEVGPAWHAALYRFLIEFTGSTDIKRNFFELYNLLGDPALLLPQPNGFTLSPDPVSHELCCPPAEQAVYTIEVGQLGEFIEPVTLALAGEPAGATVNFSVNSSPPPFTSVLTVGNLTGVSPGEYDLVLSGTTASIQRATSLDLSISNDVPGQVTLLSPSDGAIDVSRSPTLSWQLASGALQYDLEVASDPAFSTVLYSTVAYGTEQTPGLSLDALTSYYWHVRAVNACGDSGFSPTFSFTTLEQTDYFTERFTDGFDLENFTIVLVEDGSGNHYSTCGAAATELPTDPSGGSSLSLTDDAYVSVTPSAPVWIYGTAYSSFYINANGNLTFTSGDGTWNETLEVHFSQPRVSGFFDDLTPAGGTVSWRDLSDRAAVTWEDVPEYGTSNSNTFQIELFYNGNIRITWLGMDSNDAIVGPSRGDGIPDDYLEYDVSTVGTCLGDVDVDGDVDSDDYAHWPACMTGPNGGPYDPGCGAFDYEADDDVDLADFAQFQVAFANEP